MKGLQTHEKLYVLIPQNITMKSVFGNCNSVYEQFTPSAYKPAFTQHVSTR